YYIKTNRGVHRTAQTRKYFEILKGLKGGDKVTMAMSEEIFRQTGIPDGYKIRIRRKDGYMWIKDTKEGQVHSRYRFHNIGRYVLVEEESEASRSERASCRERG